MDDTKPRHGDRVNVSFDEEADQPLTLGPQHLVHVVDEHGFSSDIRSELEHRLVREIGSSGVELLDHPPI